jgi:hypothetical protein
MHISLHSVLGTISIDAWPRAPDVAETTQRMQRDGNPKAIMS